MPENWRGITPQDMLLEWAKAELPEERFHDWNRTDIKEKLRAGLSISEPDLTAAIQTLFGGRWPMLLYFFQNSTRWYMADFPATGLGAVRADLHFDPLRTLADVANNNPGMAILNFRLERMRGRLVLVAQKPDGPYTLIEGAHRACSILKMDPASQEEPALVPVVIGVCESIGLWNRWRD